MNYKILLFFFLFIFSVQSQELMNQSFPKFKNCYNNTVLNDKDCFFQSIKNHLVANFKVPVAAKNYKGEIKALFEVDTTGTFKILYAEVPLIELKDEVHRVFNLFEKIEPAYYQGRKVYVKYAITIPIPLDNTFLTNSNLSVSNTIKKQSNDLETELTEYQDIQLKNYENNLYKGSHNIAFTHANYLYFDRNINLVGSNNHTASKPYSFSEIARYYDFESEFNAIKKNKTSWWGRKLWNEPLVSIVGDGYWFTINPILNLNIGKDFGSINSYTYVNTRGVSVNGQLGKQLFFSTQLYESQGLFADYYNQIASSLKPSGGSPAIIPGIGIAKQFKENAFDFPLAEANIKYTPNQFIDLQLGYGRNFIGDGYRSLLQGDGTSPYPFFKINTTFWKIKYTNTYMWLKDVRVPATVDKTYTTKFMANHYLSWNVSKRMNIGFFESVVWGNDNNRGFDATFVNPIIFYRAVEFSSSSKAGNALLGATTKYKWNNNINFYGQFLLDEFSIADMKAGTKSWKNKFAYQIGIKYYNALNINNLILQLEYNRIRPYVYAHSNVITNYGHNNQSMGNNWGANASELIGIASYFKGRFFAQLKVNYGFKGLDFTNSSDIRNYGNNIYLSYDDNRAFNNGVLVGQGNKTTILIADFQAGYIINPSSNMKVFANLMYRDFKPTTEDVITKTATTTWFSAGIKTDLFNWYFDY
ncbi:MAG TPA: gliding motility protein RemB [Flavobacterium sp.]|nr:gliding motility protein RemB [Flavobacterium sp.]